MKAFVQHRFPDSDKAVIQGLVSFVELNSRALFTQKVLSNDVQGDESLFYDVDANAEYYQRRLDRNRIREIKKYIYNSVLDERDGISASALFPTSMIIAFEKDVDVSDWADTVSIDFSDEDQEKGIDKDLLYIVDGQHRLMAMRLLYQDLKSTSSLTTDSRFLLDYLENYKFSCTILVNFDIWEQGQVFVNVNFRQKPVNRSLYYDVFGAEYIESDNPNSLLRNKIFMCHTITRFMNVAPGSPFQNKIKMLGTGHGYISQSFFVEALLPNFKSTGIWYFDPMSKDSSQDVLDACESELYNYFLIVSRCFKKYWGANEDGKVHFICKTTGVGAFTRLMSVFHRKLDHWIIDTFKEMNPGSEIGGEYQHRLKYFLSPLVAAQDILFGPESIYSGSGGGKGLEKGLFNDMLRLLVDAGMLTEDETISKRRYSRR